MQTTTIQTSYKNAIQHYNKTINELPTYAQAYNHRGIVYGNIGRLT